MNKEKIVKELNGYVKGLDSKLSVVNDDDLTLDYNCDGQAWFGGFDRNAFSFNVDPDLTTLFAKEGYLTKFYNKTLELMDKYEAKYTVQVIKGDDDSYLNFEMTTKKLSFDNTVSGDRIKANFTKSEIEELKKRDDVAIDWDKVIIKEVTD